MQEFVLLEVGSLNNDNNDSSENKMCPLKLIIMFIWTPSIGQMRAIFPRVEFSRT